MAYEFIVKTGASYFPCDKGAGWEHKFWIRLHRYETDGNGGYTGKMEVLSAKSGWRRYSEDGESKTFPCDEEVFLFEDRLAEHIVNDLSEAVAKSFLDRVEWKDNGIAWERQADGTFERKEL